MKTTLKSLLLMLAAASASYADYVWQGGETVTSESWAIETNWQLTGSSTWNTGTAGPGTNVSTADQANGVRGMYGPIVVANATGTLDSTYIDGWDLNLTLQNSNLTFYRVGKFQNDNGQGSTINIDANSSLTFNEFWGGNDGEYVYLNNAGSFTLCYSCRTQGGDGFVMNLYDTGRVTFLDQNHDTGNNVAKVSSIAAQLTSTQVNTVVSRQLISLDAREGKLVTISNSDPITYTFTDAEGNGMVAVDSLEALESATVNSYFVTNDESGISVSYKLVQAVPEPATATLSLLALCGLAARRRRCK